MSFYLLTWNPGLWKWNIEKSRKEIEKFGYSDSSWSTGMTKKIKVGDRVFMLRQVEEPTGIIAAGDVLTDNYEDEHWDKSRKNKKANYVKVRWTWIIGNLEDPKLLLKPDVIRGFPHPVRASGLSVLEEVADQIKLFMEASEANLEFGEQMASKSKDAKTSKYLEGSPSYKPLTRHERSKRARKACIEHYGSKCLVCKIDFEVIYGDIGKGFIHVHHIEMVANKTAPYFVDPITDMRPVCPNCHAMLHSSKLPMNIDDLRKRMDLQKCERGDGTSES